MISREIASTAKALLDAADGVGFSNQFLDTAFHTVASAYDQAEQAAMGDGVLGSLQGAADLLVAMQEAKFAPPHALALIGCWLEGVAHHVADLEGTTPAPARAAGATILRFPGPSVVPSQEPRGDAA